MNKNKEAVLNDFLGEDNYREGDYLVCDDAEANQAVKENILESLWAFRASFILSHSNVEMEACDLEAIQGKMCESANSLVKALIKDLDYFIADAISADGRGHFLASYDGEEIEHDYNGETYYIYRLN
jgi:hypothetical protein